MIDPASIDLPRLGGYLRERGLDLGELRSRLITGGRSNLTYEIADERRRWVLRMPPRGADARTHDVAREARILRALAASDVPVPRVEAVCLDPDLLGAPFYVARFVDGLVLGTRADADALAAPLRAVTSRSAVERLAAIHAVSLEDVGLDGLGRGAGYVERQLRRWSAYVATSDLPGAALLTAVHGDLAEDVPEAQRLTLVHGDYKLPNVLVDGASGVVRAVLDWELATVGDPLADLGNLLAMWPAPGEPALIDSATSAEGFLSRDEIVADYRVRTGLDVSRIAWYHAFGTWKVACILASVVERYRGGAMAEDDFEVDAGAELVTDLARSCREILSNKPSATATGRATTTSGGVADAT